MKDSKSELLLKTSEMTHALRKRGMKNIDIALIADTSNTTIGRINRLDDRNSLRLLKRVYQNLKSFFDSSNTNAENDKQQFFDDDRTRNAIAFLKDKGFRIYKPITDFVDI